MKRFAGSSEFLGADRKDS